MDADKTETKQGRELTESERTFIDDFKAECAACVTVPRAELREADSEEKTLTLKHDSTNDFELAEAVLCRALGTTDKKYAGSLINSIANASASSGLLNSNGADIIGNAIVAANALHAESPAEGMLIAQMIAVHNSAMEAMRRMHNVEMLEHFNSYSNQANKLMRTFTAQMEALKRYRQKASQTVRVDHVHVNEGGQAIVGDVHHTGGRGPDQKNGGQPHGPRLVSHEPSTPMRCKESTREAVPVTRDAE